MTVFEKTDRFLRNLYETAFYFAVMAVKENFRNYVGRAGICCEDIDLLLLLQIKPVR